MIGGSVFANSWCRTRVRLRHGFTLLEVIVALALSVVVVGLLASAIRLHLITLDKQSRKIEYKQVARTVVTMVANDLRNAVQHKPIDLSVLEELAASQQAMLGNLESAGAGEAVGEAEQASEEEAELIMAEESEVVGRSKLVGDNLVLSVDISRVPRLDEYNALTSGDVLRLPSDIKNITYFMDPNNNTSTAPKFDVVSNAAPGGLYRRNIDRAFATNRGEEGVVTNLDEFAELIAPEIAQISFRYFDGEDFQDEWNSEESGGFPQAIEITIVIDPERMNAEGNYQYGGFNPDTMERFQLVVDLPTAE